MNRRQLIPAVAMLPFGYSAKLLAKEESALEPTAAVGNRMQWGATWVDSRDEPRLWYTIRLSLYLNHRAEDLILGPPQHYFRDPASYILDEFELELVRHLSPMEFILPAQGDLPRHDAAFWVKKPQRVGPCIISSIGTLMVEQAAVAASAMRSGMSTPADVCILSVLERATEVNGEVSSDELEYLHPTEDELRQAGLESKLSEFFIQE